jgi:Mor family transcriptional regulator
VREAGELDDAALQRIEGDIRRDWGGERAYIAKQGEHGRAVQSARDECIRRDFRRGERIELLCRRYGLSARRVQEIVREVRAA